MRVHIFFQVRVFVFFGWIPNSGITGSYGSSIFNFLRNLIVFSVVAIPIYIPFSPHPCQHLSCVLDNSHSNECEVISHCGFGFHFPDDYWCWAPFHVPAGHLFVVSGKKCQVLCPFLNGMGFFQSQSFLFLPSQILAGPNIFFTTPSPRTSPTNLFQTHHSLRGRRRGQEGS